MNKQLELITDIMSSVILLAKCSKTNCLEQKKRLEANKILFEKYKNVKNEPNKQKRDKIINELHKDNIIYEYDKCIIKHCKKMYLDIIIIIKKYVNALPPNNPARIKLNTIFIELDKLLNKPNLTKKEYVEFFKYSSDLMQNMR